MKINFYNFCNFLFFYFFIFSFFYFFNFYNNRVFPWGVNFYEMSFIRVYEDKTNEIKVDTPRKNPIIIIC